MLCAGSKQKKTASIYDHLVSIGAIKNLVMPACVVSTRRKVKHLYCGLCGKAFRYIRSLTTHFYKHPQNVQKAVKRDRKFRLKALFYTAELVSDE